MQLAVVLPGQAHHRAVVGPGLVLEIFEHAFFHFLPLLPAGDVSVGDIGDAVVAVMHHGLAGFAQRQRNALGDLNQSVYHIHGGVPFSLKNSYKYYTISG